MYLRYPRIRRAGRQVLALAQDTFANRPAASLALKDTLFRATDNGILYRCDGEAWVEILRGEAVTRLAQLVERAHASLTDVTTDQHHAKVHGLGEHVVASARIAHGLLADRPAAAVVGRLYYATDTKIVYWDDGTAWLTVGTTLHTALTAKEDAGIIDHADGSVTLPKLARLPLAIPLLLNIPSLSFVDPGTAWVEPIDLSRLRVCVDTALYKFTEARVVITASGNETGTGKGIQVYNVTGTAAVCEVLWDGDLRKYALAGAWTAWTNPAADIVISIRIKASSATEDLEISAVMLQVR